MCGCVCVVGWLYWLGMWEEELHLGVLLPATVIVTPYLLNLYVEDSCGDNSWHLLITCFKPGII